MGKLFLSGTALPPKQWKASFKRPSDSGPCSEGFSFLATLCAAFIVDSVDPHFVFQIPETFLYIFFCEPSDEFH